MIIKMYTVILVNVKILTVQTRIAIGLVSIQKYHRSRHKNIVHYRFSRPFSSPLHSILENVFSISSRTLWNVRMLVPISSLVDQFWNIVFQFRALSPAFVNFNSNSSVTVAEHETAKAISYWHSFSSKFQSKSSPRCKGSITLDEFEWQNNEFVWKNDEFDPSIPNSLSDRDEFQWQLTNLDADIFNLIDKKRMWMTIWQNWTLDLNAVRFSGRNWIENWWNWMKRWRKWAGKPILAQLILGLRLWPPPPQTKSFCSSSHCIAKWSFILNIQIISLSVREDPVPYIHAPRPIWSSTIPEEIKIFVKGRNFGNFISFTLFSIL